jgi:hypothetical protein
MAIKKRISKLVELVKQEIPQKFLEDWERINLNPGSLSREKDIPSSVEKVQEKDK